MPIETEENHPEWIKAQIAIWTSLVQTFAFGFYGALLAALFAGSSLDKLQYAILLVLIGGSLAITIVGLFMLRRCANKLPRR